MRRAFVALALLVVACDQPPIAVDIPPRDNGQQVLDLAGVLDQEVAARLREIRERRGLDVVALT